MSALESVAAGAEVLDALAAACARRGLFSGMALLAGPLESARLRPGPDGLLLPLSGPLFLVQGTAVVAPDGIALYGVISWEDQGLPRMVAGQIEAAISGGVSLQILAGGASQAEPPAPIAVERVVREPAREPPKTPIPAREPPKTPTPAREPPRAATPPREPPRDVTVTKAKPTSMSDLIREGGTAPAQPSKAGWAAAVAASSRTPVARPTAPAVPRLGGAPSPDELGFEEIPSLQIGDVLVHPRFGRCQVSKVGARDRVKVRRSSGATIDLALDVCRFVREPDDEAGRRVYRLILEG